MPYDLITSKLICDVLISPSIFIFIVVTTIAHRGWSAKYPENTLLAFRQAITRGADAIEFDVHQSQDGELVVIHDADVTRTTNGSGNLSQLSFSDLRVLDAGQGEQIPLLRDVLELGRGQVQFQLEVKVPGIEESILNCIDEVDVSEDVYFSSFGHSIMKVVKDLRPAAKVATIESTVTFATDAQEERMVARFLKNAQKVGALAVHVNRANVTPLLVTTAHAADLRVNVWTVDTVPAMQELVSMGVDGIFSNEIDLLINTIRRIEER